jgi:hypothetical protein
MFPAGEAGVKAWWDPSVGGVSLPPVSSALGVVALQALLLEGVELRLAGQAPVGFWLDPPRTL